MRVIIVIVALCIVVAELQKAFIWPKKNVILRSMVIHLDANVATECNMAEKDIPTQPSVGIGC